MNALRNKDDGFAPLSEFRGRLCILQPLCFPSFSDLAFASSKSDANMGVNVAASERGRVINTSLVLISKRYDALILDDSETRWHQAVKTGDFSGLDTKLVKWAIIAMMRPHVEPMSDKPEHMKPRSDDEWFSGVKMHLELVIAQVAEQLPHFSPLFKELTVPVFSVVRSLLRLSAKLFDPKSHFFPTPTSSPKPTRLSQLFRDFGYCRSRSYDEENIPRRASPKCRPDIKHKLGLRGSLVKRNVENLTAKVQELKIEPVH
ncbi:hypothetical protein IAR55_006849 [Kwoniella newhampshirensis]|uniref:Uncharacterized protein n=1 Tax=Kwoniella newhampshirensis TaxID=1651941 RepID=A0AAW0YGN0_9TREE